MDGLNLKPCPFCGGEARLTVQSYPGGDRYRVCCTDCGATTWPRIISGKDAAKAWNRRKGDTTNDAD